VNMESRSHCELKRPSHPKVSPVKSMLMRLV
jgi:hypothetical protein